LPLLDFLMVGPKRHHRNVLRPGHHLVVACRYLRGGAPTHRPSTTASR
jgi:hypothetical protein